MRVLLIHPEDDPANGPWVSARWDRIVDLGMASGASGELPGSTVEPLPSLDGSDFARIRRALSFGSGVLIDDHGLDWWDLLSIEFHQQLEEIQILRRFAQTLSPTDEISATRPSLASRMLEVLLGRKLKRMSRSESKLIRRARQTLKFRPKQLVEILWDKYDSSYRLRRLISPQEPRCPRPVVLLPSSYVNASRGALAYASALPDFDFLLVVTRASGRMSDVPSNVRCAPLSSYASGRADFHEFQRLFGIWGELESRLTANDDLAALAQFGILGGVPSHLRNGLSVRDAWLGVFDSAPVQSVFCGDEMNPSTRLPVCIAQKRGVPTASFHHGALDGRYRYRHSRADTILAKGRMEWDYLVNTCRVPQGQVQIAAPPRTPRRTPNATAPKSAVVFFSEPYEIAGSRCRDIYRQILPELARVARSNDCELILKLHPQENCRERRRIASSVLAEGKFRVVEGVLPAELLDQAWFAVTVVSSTAVDCALEGVPSFLCTWTDHSHYGYGDQFLKYDAVLPLRRPDDIATIPQALANFQMKDASALWAECDVPRLRKVLGVETDSLQMQHEIREKLWA